MEVKEKENESTKSKVFMLAGFKNVKEKDDIVAKIRKLGGHVLEGNKWRDECTHVIAADYREYMEKVMGALVAGRWVVTRRYVDRSHSYGSWYPNINAFVADQLVVQHKQRLLRQGGIFKHVKVVLLMKNVVKRGVYSRIIQAGGGEVHQDWGVGDLLTNQPGKEDLNLIVGDPSLLSPSDPRHKEFLAWLQLLSDCDRSDSIPHVYYKYLFTVVTEAKMVSPEQYSIFRPEVVDIARQDGNLEGNVDQNLLKRPPPDASNGNNKRLKSDNQNATKILTTVLPANVVTLDSDSDDDIQVLEQKLTQRRGEVGRRRTYVDKQQRARLIRTRPNIDSIIDVSDSDNEITVEEPEDDIEIQEILMEQGDDKSDEDDSDNCSKSADSRRSSVDTIASVDISEKIINKTDRRILHEDQSPDIYLSSAPATLGVKLGQIEGQAIPEDQSQSLDLINTPASLGKRTGQTHRPPLQEDRPPDLDLPNAPAALRVRPGPQPQISVGLQAAIQALQQTPHKVRAAVSPIKASATEMCNNIKHVGNKQKNIKDVKGDVDDDIQVISTKLGEKTKTKPSKHLDSRAKLFHSKLKDLQKKQSKTSERRPTLTPPVSPEPEEAPRVEVEPCPVDFPSQSVNTLTYDNKLLGQILGTILERQHMTHECVSIGYTTNRTVKFDKYKEAKVQKFKVKPVESDVKEEFYQKMQNEDSNELENNILSMREEATLASNYLSSLKYLTCSTSLSSQPTSAIIHSLMVFYLLEQPNSAVRLSAYSYLDQFIFLHLQQTEQDRDHWLSLILSACRMNVAEQDQFDLFSIDNVQDLSQCWKFFCLVVTRYQELPSKTDDLSSSGPELLFEFLVKLLQRDFETWWKHLRKTSHKDARSLTYPMLYYLLDCSRSLTSNISTSVVRLYLSLLDQAHRDLGPIRRLLSLCAMMLAHLDGQQGQSLVYTGTKLELAGSLQSGLVNRSLEVLIVELNMIQPSWLAWLVAKRLIMKLPGGTKLNNLTDLVTQLDKPQLSTKEDSSRFDLCLEVMAHRLMGSCHIHTVFRTFWLKSSKDEEVTGLAWRLVDKLTTKEVKLKSSIKFKNEVAVKISSLVSDVNTLGKFASHQKRFLSENMDNSAINSLIFRMTTSLNF